MIFVLLLPFVISVNSGAMDASISLNYSLALKKEQIEAINKYKITTDHNIKALCAKRIEVAFEKAISKKNEARVLALLQSDLINLSAPFQIFQTPLTEIIRANMVSCFDYLIKSGVDVNVCPKGNVNPLMLVCRNIKGNVNPKTNRYFFKKLLEAGADINATSSKKNTPLYFLSASNHEEIKELCSRGAQLNCKNARGHTLIESLALRFTEDDTIDGFKTMLEYGANPYDESSTQEKPIFKKFLCEHPIIKEYLQQWHDEKIAQNVLNK